MLDKDEVIEIMHDRGYTVMSYGMRGGEYISIEFLSKQQDVYRFPVPVYSLEVNLEKETFKASYIIPHSINRLSTAECGSLMDEEHFDNMLGKFENQVAILYKYTAQ